MKELITRAHSGLLVNCMGVICLSHTCHHFITNNNTDNDAGRNSPQDPCWTLPTHCPRTPGPVLGCVPGPSQR